MALLNGDAFTVVAHRGDSAHYPENTFPAFDAAVEGGFPHFETDCQLTSDGSVVVLHDEQLGRTTPGAAGAVADASWTQLSQLDAGSWFSPAFADTRVPLLSELLQRYRGRAHMHLELKSEQPELPARVAAELQAAGWLLTAAGSSGGGGGGGGAAGGAEHGHGGGPEALQGPGGPAQGPHPHFAVPGLTVTSFHMEQLRRSLQVMPGVTHGWLIQELTEERIQEALSAGLHQLCPRANALSPGDVRRAVAAGFSVRAWGVRDMQLLHRVVGCGCHGATVNWPPEARDALAAPTAPAEARAAAEAAAAERGRERAAAAAAGAAPAQS